MSLSDIHLSRGNCGGGEPSLPGKEGAAEMHGLVLRHAPRPCQCKREGLQKGCWQESCSAKKFSRASARGRGQRSGCRCDSIDYIGVAIIRKKDKYKHYKAKFSGERVNIRLWLFIWVFIEYWIPLTFMLVTKSVWVLFLKGVGKDNIVRCKYFSRHSKQPHNCCIQLHFYILSLNK